MINPSRRLSTPWPAVAALVAAACVVAACGAREKVETGFRDRDGQQPPFAGDMTALLLPREMIGPRLRLADAGVVSTADVARFFGDADAALQAMTDAGQRAGAIASYQLAGQPTASEPILAISSSAVAYETVAGAGAVLRDPTTILLIGQFEPTAGEFRGERVGDESRLFRAARSDGAIAYLSLFRRRNVICGLVVLMPRGSDDGGRAAIRLSRRQAAVPFPMSPAQ